MSVDPTGRVVGGGMYARRKEDAVPDCISPCRVTQGHFPDPAEALALGWTPAQIMANCRRMARDNLTPELERHLLVAGLTPEQVRELYRHWRSYISSMRNLARMNKDDDLHEKESVKMSITFDKVLAIGMPPKKALEECLPARLKDITKEHLQACVDGGLTVEEIAKGFGTTKSSVNWKAGAVKFKFREARRQGGDGANKGSTDTPEVPPAGDTPAGGAMAGGDEVAAAAATTVAVAHANKAAAVRTPTPEELAAMFEDSGRPAETVPKPEPISPAPVANPWTRRFGITSKFEGPELMVCKDGKLMIRRVDMDVDLRYAFDFDVEFRRCRVTDCPQGMKIWKPKDEVKIFSCSLRQLAKELAALGLKFPVRYRLNPETMEGDRQ